MLNRQLDHLELRIIPSHHILQTSTDANDLRLNLHEERISRAEVSLAKIDIVAETVAREVADLKLAKAAGAFEREERNIRLNPQDREAWGKKNDGEKIAAMSALITELLDEGMNKRSKVLLIRENQRNPAWIKISLKYQTESTFLQR